jgi:hypothetical protein
MAESTSARPQKKSPKPYEGFPLTQHPSGRWCKKIRGKLHYFGKLDSSDAALGHSVCAQVGTCLGGSPAGNVGAAAEGPAGGGWRRGRKRVCGTRFTAHSWPVCARQTRSIGHARPSTRHPSAPFLGEPNWAKSHGRPQSRLETSRRHRWKRNSLGSQSHGGQCPRRDAIAADH